MHLVKSQACWMAWHGLEEQRAGRRSCWSDSMGQVSLCLPQLQGSQQENLHFSIQGMAGVIIYSLLWSQFRKAVKCLPHCLQDQKQK